jgi:hypothetical protein
VRRPCDAVDLDLCEIPGGAAGCAISDNYIAGDSVAIGKRLCPGIVYQHLNLSRPRRICVWAVHFHHTGDPHRPVGPIDIQAGCGRKSSYWRQI